MLDLKRLLLLFFVLRFGIIQETFRGKTQIPRPININKNYINKTGQHLLFIIFLCTQVVKVYI